LASPEQAAVVRSGQRRYRQPKPPRIQALLRQTRDLRVRLDREADLTREALASGLGMTPTRLTYILNLLNLAPDILERIMALPPVAGLGPITERQLRPLARIRDQAVQMAGFEDLLRRACKGPQDP
jgi:hypothetical protein